MARCLRKLPRCPPPQHRPQHSHNTNHRAPAPAATDELAAPTPNTSTIIMMRTTITAAATLLLSAAGAAAQQATCDPALEHAEPPCPYGKWCPGDGVCPKNPCLSFPCGERRSLCLLCAASRLPLRANRPRSHSGRRYAHVLPCRIARAVRPVAPARLDHARAHAAVYLRRGLPLLGR